MATIKDVAHLSGVSVSTVSRVLNNSGYVNPKTKHKVLKAIEALEYKPSQIARGLVSRKTRTLGLMLPDITNPFFPELARAVEDKAHEKGYALILCNSDNDLGKEEKYFDLLQEKSVDGIIFSGEVRLPFLQRLQKKQTPLVVVDARTDHMTVHSIYTDNRYGGQLGTWHLIEQGYKRIAHIRGPYGSMPAEDRYRGYQDALKQAGIEIDPILVQPGNFDLQSGYEAMLRLLSLNDVPDAVFVANDLMALGAMEAIFEKKLRIPDDIGVVGYDGIPLTRIARPKLSTVEQPVYQMGTLAAETLITRLEHPDSKVESVVLKPTLRIAGSSHRRDVDEKEC
ncbi:MAG: Ribose operon repressor [Candidatus Carbobacillus altaicus]|uniref:Ribose operon repressor n=1 Tax=Candidatus Carbonibacillus altaicus TaxID=2163959 RepID=A0A2R6Y0T3_9BACL|nr:MAG: Ribose operon repressor [Candidatus Carbobacillus altaicus]